MADETVYRDPTPVGEKEEVLKTSNLRQPTTKYVAYIRSKEYGVDVRESIARGIEAIQYNTDEQTNEIKKDNEKYINNLKDEIIPSITQEVIAEVGKGNTDAEVVNSRNDTVNKKQYASLSLRLNAMSEKTNENENNAEEKFQTPKITASDGKPILTVNSQTPQKDIWEELDSFIAKNKNGQYYVRFISRCVNAPANIGLTYLAGTLYVSDNGVQNSIIVSSTYSGVKKVFFASKNSTNTWSGWSEVATVELAQMIKVSQDNGNPLHLITTNVELLPQILQYADSNKQKQTFYANGSVLQKPTVNYGELVGSFSRYGNTILVECVDLEGNAFKNVYSVTKKAWSGWNIQRNWVTIFVGERGLTNKETATFTKTGVIKSIRVSSSHTETVEYLDITKDNVDYLQQWTDNTSSSSIISPNASTNTLTVRHVTGAFGIKIRKIEVCLV